MPFDILTFGEALVEVMRTDVDQPLHSPGPFAGPYPSGAPFIFAVQAARLGSSVAAIGAVGEDAFGRCLLDQLRVDGVSTEGVRVLPSHTTGVAFVAYNADGSRNFVFHITQAAAGQITADMLDQSLFHGLRCLHVMGSTLSIHQDALETGFRALEMAQIVGARISFDPNLRPELLPAAIAREAFHPFLVAADVVLPTAEELLLLTEQATVSGAIGQLLEKHPDRLIVVKQGAQGSTVYSDSGLEHVPGFAVEEVDPTGAGDCFDAAFLVKWLSGTMPGEAARFANACGVLAVTAHGPMSGAYDFDTVNQFIQSQ